MNLLMASVFLLAMLAFQPTLIYGSKKNLALVRNGNANGGPNRSARSTKYGKRHSMESSAMHPLYSPALSSSAKLVLSMDSGDEVLVRAARGASVIDSKTNPASSSSASSSSSSVGGGIGKRQKGNNNKKSNKNLATRESAAAAAGASAATLSSSPAGHKHLDKKLSAASGLSRVNQQQQQQQQSSNGKGKQRQLLKSQNSHHGKRSGNNGSKALRDNTNPLHGEGEKSPSCRYSKSAWSDCDTTTNMRTRTLNLKKGDSSCVPTRTMQKKCKKACRYEKGAWSECINGQMTREDKLKSTGGGGTESLSSSCEPLRSMKKKCNPNNGGTNGNSKQASGSGGSKKERKNKDKASRRNQSQQQQQQQQQQ